MDTGPDPAPSDGPAPGSPMDRLAHALRRERERRGLSLSETAKRAGIGKSTLSQLEGGSGNPSVETLWALATALDVQLSQLLDPDRPQMSVGVRRWTCRRLPRTTPQPS